VVSTLTGTGVVPDRIETTLPIVPEVGSAVAGVIRAVATAWGAPTHVAGVGEAARAVTDELVACAGVWSILGLSVERDDVDIYVRLSADVVPGTEPTLSGTTRASVALATASHHVALEGSRLVVVLQTALR
jgi:hypothetical protein